MTSCQRMHAILEITILGAFAVLIVFAIYRGINP